MYIIYTFFYFICFVYIWISLLIFDYLIFFTFYINGKVILNMTLWNDLLPRLQLCRCLAFTMNVSRVESEWHTHPAAFNLAVLWIWLSAGLWNRSSCFRIDLLIQTRVLVLLRLSFMRTGITGLGWLRSSKICHRPILTVGTAEWSSSSSAQIWFARAARIMIKSLFQRKTGLDF